MGLRLGLCAQRLLLSGTALRHKLGLRSAAGRDAAGAQRHSARATGLRGGVGEGTWLSAKRPGEWKGLMLRLVTDQSPGKQESGLSRACPRCAYSQPSSTSLPFAGGCQPLSSPRSPSNSSLSFTAPVCLTHAGLIQPIMARDLGTRLRQYQRHRARLCQRNTERCSRMTKRRIAGLVA